MKSLTPICGMESLLKRKEELNELIKRIEPIADRCPEGSVYAMKKGTRYEYYLRSESSQKNGKYVKKKEMPQISRLMQTMYLRDVYKAAKEELKNIDCIIKKYPDNKLANIYSNLNGGIKKYINPIDMSDEDYKIMWENEQFERKGDERNDKDLYSDKGEHVRSKSELNIANALFKHGIAYKYEKAMKMPNGMWYHPDFTVLNSRTRKEYIWEHLGMMDSMSYVADVIDRMEQYKRKGLFLGRDILITYETREKVLGTREIERMIEMFLL